MPDLPSAPVRNVGAGPADDNSSRDSAATRLNPAGAISHSEVDKQLKQLAATARKSIIKSVEAMLQLAAIIAAAHALLACKGRSSKFGRWVTEQVGISRSQAYELRRALGGPASDRAHGPAGGKAG